MSLADAGPRTGARPRAALVTRRRGAALRLVRSELRLVFGRRRNQVLLVGLGLVPLLIGITVKLASSSPQPGEGPAFLDRVSGNGLFLVFTTLVVSLPLFLPLTVGIVSGDAVAGEANVGTLRYLLTVPVGRTRLLLAKALGSMAFAAAAVAVVAVVGLVAGAALFGLGDTTLLSGEAVPVGNGLLRGLGIALYVTASMSGLVVVGLFLSTLTEVPVAAMAATVVVAVVNGVLDALPQVAAIHPYLLTHHWLDFGELLRTPVDLGTLASGLLVQVGWVVVAGALAWSRFTTADITS